jgi:hypothetical protein
MTAQELGALSERDFVSHIWGNDIIQAIDNQTTTPMTMDEFLNHCTTCGGNWGGMLLTGLQELYPKVYEAIPDDMGMFAFRCICDTLTLLNIQS